MQGTEEQAAADVDRGCRDNAFGDKRYLVVGKVAKSTGGTPGTRSQLSPRLCSAARAKESSTLVLHQRGRGLLTKWGLQVATACRGFSLGTAMLAKLGTNLGENGA